MSGAGKYDYFDDGNKLGCGYVCLRKFVNLFNIVFVLIGFLLIGVGVYLHMSELSNWYGKSMPLVLMCSGGFIFMLAFLGLCGACNENKCLLWVYSFVLMILIIAQVAVVVIGITQSGVIESYLNTAWIQLEEECQLPENWDDQGMNNDDGGADADAGNGGEVEEAEPEGADGEDADAEEGGEVADGDAADGGEEGADDVQEEADPEEEESGEAAEEGDDAAEEGEGEAGEDAGNEEGEAEEGGEERRRLQDDPDYSGCIIFGIEKSLECCCFSQDQCDPNNEDLAPVEAYCIEQIGDDAPGCYEAAQADIQANYTLAIGIAGGVGGLQALLFLATCCLMNGISAKNERKALKTDNYGQYGAAV